MDSFTLAQIESTGNREAFYLSISKKEITITAIEKSLTVLLKYQYCLSNASFKMKQYL